MDAGGLDQNIEKAQLVVLKYNLLNCFWPCKYTPRLNIDVCDSTKTKKPVRSLQTCGLMALNKLTSFGSIQHTDDICNLLTFLYFSPKLQL